MTRRIAAVAVIALCIALPAGADRKFVPAEAKIDPSTGSGQAGKTVVVRADTWPVVGQPESTKTGAARDRTGETVR